MRAFVFPGQGSQRVGMGQELSLAIPAAREVFEEVDEALKQNLTRIIFNGPEDELTLTENAQPALLAVSMAVVRAVEAESGVAIGELGDYVAGHSLGEYSALASVGALGVSDAARLLQLRGASMQRAVAVGEGAMAALIGVNIDIVEKIVKDSAGKDICNIANDNGPGQVVISGHSEAVERAIKLSIERGARRAILLPVSAPFHCSLMSPAAEEMIEALESVIVSTPAIPLVSNVHAKDESEPSVIRTNLIEQVTSMVRWRESVLFMRKKGVYNLIEIGSGNTLSGINRRIDSELTVMSVSTPEMIEEFLKKL